MSSLMLAPCSMATDGREESSDREWRAPESDLLSFYERTYFLTGFTEHTQVKFNFSLKYELWPNRSPHSVFFAYSQLSLWDLWSFAESSPFVESNYVPEVFYRLSQEWIEAESPGCGLVDEQVGLRHESNGRGGARSRSWNRVYAGVRAACKGRDDQLVEWGLRVWLPFGLRDNQDIVDYLGLGELSVRYETPHARAWYGTAELAARGRKGVAQRGSLVLEAAWRPGYENLFAGAWRLTPYLFGQLFVGYGETLESYDQRRTSGRVGFGFRDEAP